MDKLYASCNLCSIPFLGHTDNTRLQMSSKQLGQALTNIRCEVPKVIGSNFRYLSYNSTLFRMVAEHNGIVTFVNDDIMIITYMCDNGSERILSIDVSPIIQCTSLSSTKLRYKREVGYFSKGDILYEYDSFKHNIPTYGLIK